MKVLHSGFLLILVSGIFALIIYITDVTNLYEISQPSHEDLEALKSLQNIFQKCVHANGLGLQAIVGKDLCEVAIKFPGDTISKWVRNSSTVLTREFIDALPNGWEDYAWRRINKGIQLNRCANITLCEGKLSLVLPQTPPYVPLQFDRCAVIGNSGDLLKTIFGKEIDEYDVVIRENGAPIQNYTDYVSKKSTFRLLNGGSAKALDKVVDLDETRKEVLLIKSTIHDIMNKMIKEIPIGNPVYLMLGTSFGLSAKGTGVKALEFALSICESVDMYGFTVDPGYKEWTRYFSESRQGHTPLHGRAYYQMMECLGLIKIHSPMRADPNRIVKFLPNRNQITVARTASDKVLRRIGAGSADPLAACSAIKGQRKRSFNQLISIQKPAINHQQYVRGATMYPLERSPGHGSLCTVPTEKNRETVRRRSVFAKRSWAIQWRNELSASSRLFPRIWTKSQWLGMG